MSQEAQIVALSEKLESKRKFLGPNWKERIEAARELGETRDPAAIPPLISAIDRQENADLCRAAIASLAQIGGAQAIQALVRLLSAPAHRDVHATILVALSQMEDESAQLALKQVSSDPARRQALIAGLIEDLHRPKRC